MTQPSLNNLDASFSMLITSLASTSLMSMGLAPNPQTGHPDMDLAMARFNIDMLEVLQTKTKGNLSSDEARFLDSVLSDLKLKYVQTKEGAKK